MSDHYYAVVRPEPDEPGLPRELSGRGWFPQALNGRWYDLLRERGPIALGDSTGLAIAIPTGEYEVRGDGQRAEVYEIKKPGSRG